jgi:hypothetical protein
MAIFNAEYLFLVSAAYVKEAGVCIPDQVLIAQLFFFIAYCPWSSNRQRGLLASPVVHIQANNDANISLRSKK